MGSTLAVILTYKQGSLPLPPLSNARELVDRELTTNRWGIDLHPNGPSSSRFAPEHAPGQQSAPIADRGETLANTLTVSVTFATAGIFQDEN